MAGSTLTRSLDASREAVIESCDAVVEAVIE
jgi:hypothetical protein